MNLKTKAENIIKTLEELYPDPACGLFWEGDPYRLLIMAILSAQCTDARVNIVAKTLFARFPTVYDMARAELSDIENEIRSVGLYRTKALALKESNGVDDEGNVIPSSAYLAEHKASEDNWGFFARSRFPHVQTFFEEWNAEIVRQAIDDGIVEQARVEGASLVGFSEVVEKYESTFKLDFDEAMNKIFDYLDEADDRGLSEDADNILLQYVNDVSEVNKLTKKQMAVVQSIFDELQELLQNE